MINKGINVFILTNKGNRVYKTINNGNKVYIMINKGNRAFEMIKIIFFSYFTPHLCLRALYVVK